MSVIISVYHDMTNGLITYLITGCATYIELTHFTCGTSETRHDICTYCYHICHKWKITCNITLYQPRGQSSHLGWLGSEVLLKWQPVITSSSNGVLLELSANSVQYLARDRCSEMKRCTYKVVLRLSCALTW